MGKLTMKKKKRHTSHRNDSHPSSSTPKVTITPKLFDENTTIFADMANDMKDEGNRLFQMRDYKAAVLAYEKAIKLLPRSHPEVPCIRSNLAASYMQMGPQKYHLAIAECNAALQLSPNFIKALLKRARCYESLHRYGLAQKDVDAVLTLEPNNLTALEIAERIKKAPETKGADFDEKALVLPSEEQKLVRKKKKKSHHHHHHHNHHHNQHKAKDNTKVVVEAAAAAKTKAEEPVRPIKFVFGDDIRCAHAPADCSLVQLREVARTRFPSLKAFLMKYRDKESDLVTITTTEELRLAEDSGDHQGSIRLYIAEVKPEHDQFFEEEKKGLQARGPERHAHSFSFSDTGSIRCEEEDSTLPCIDSWIIRFAQLFKNHVGFESDEELDLHELGMKFSSETMEDAVTCEEAQEIFESAEERFQELAALALFNWGNVYMSEARKRVFLCDHASKESILAQIKSVYKRAQGEYVQAGKKYEEALHIKPDFCEGLIALGEQQFEQAKLSWYNAIANNVDLGTWQSVEVFKLFIKANDNMRRGMEMWEKMEEQRLKNPPELDEEKTLFKEMGLDGFFKGLSSEEAAEQASIMRSQINLLWGIMLYERSVVEFKLDHPTWEECLMGAVEKFKLAGSPQSDLDLLVKNHIARKTTQEGAGFKIDDIVHAWSEISDAKRWTRGVPSFRLEPLFRRRVSRLHHVWEHV